MRSLARCMVAVLVMLAIPLAFAPSVQAQANTCNGNLQINYVSGPSYALPGDIYRVELSLGTGSITGGTKMSINRVRFELDCASAGVPCTDDGNVIKYKGDGTITTNCSGVSWVSNASDLADPYTPNDVVFTPTPAIQIDANTANYCWIRFDVEVASRSNDSTPGIVEQYAGFTIEGNDAVCDNGLKSGSQQSGSIFLCPVCDDGNYCNGTETCDQQSGQCKAGTDVVCPDIYYCSEEFCNEEIDDCDSRDISSTVCPDNLFCADVTCNEQYNRCDTTDISSTVCPEDGDACTTITCNEDYDRCDTTTKTCSEDPNVPDVCEYCDPHDGLCKIDLSLDPICMPQEAICRTPGFWMTHGCGTTGTPLYGPCEGKAGAQNITQQVINACGGCLEVCGTNIKDTKLGSFDSAIEGMCDNPGKPLFHLIAMALNCCISGFGPDCGGGGDYLSTLFSEANASCAARGSYRMKEVDCWNNGGTWRDDTCWMGICEGTDTYCNSSTDTCVCIPIPNNCRDMDLCNEDMGLCFDEGKPAGSTAACNTAKRNSCKLLSSGCSTGTKFGDCD